MKENLLREIKRCTQKSPRWLNSAVFVFAAFLLIVNAATAQTEKPRPLDSKTALIIIDVQAFYFADGFMPLVAPEEASANCKKLIGRFRDQNLTVVHVGHNVSKDGDFHPDVKPVEGEKIIKKDEVSAFNGTELLDYLKGLGLDRLIICGMQTHMCVEGAVRAGYDLGFECILVGDACATKSLKSGDKVIDSADVHDSTLKTLEGSYATVMDTGTFLETY